MLPKLPELPSLDELDKLEKQKTKKSKPKIPKSEYDEEGNPILMIPDLDDVDLNSEIEKFFGEEDD